MRSAFCLEALWASSSFRQGREALVREQSMQVEGLKGRRFRPSWPVFEWSALQASTTSAQYFQGLTTLAGRTAGPVGRKTM